MSVKNSNILGVYVQSGSTMTEAITGTIAGSDADYTAHDYTGVADGDYIYTNGGSATFINVASEVATESLWNSLAAPRTPLWTSLTL